MDRFLYHSFPRRGKIYDDEKERGLRILELILKNGLLLTPEVVSWRDPLSSSGEKMHAHQRRACFTELSVGEVPGHANKFGLFSLEIDPEQFLEMGGAPVMYIPDRAANAGYEVLPTSLLSHLATAQAMLGKMVETLALGEGPLEMTITRKRGPISLLKFSEEEASAIRRYLSVLADVEGVPPNETANALKAMSSLFYPTENFDFNSSLHYYRQREWRVFSGGHLDGVPICQFPTQIQLEELVELDRAFFTRKISFPEGEFTVAEKSQFMREVRGRPLVSLVRRVLVPTGAEVEAQELSKRYGSIVPVDTLQSPST